MSHAPEPPTAVLATLDGVLRLLVRDVVREVVREELAVARVVAPPTPQVQPLPQFLTVRAAAAQLGVSGKTIRAWVTRGELRAGRAGRVLRIERGELARFLASRGPDASAVDIDIDAVAGAILARRRP